MAKAVFYIKDKVQEAGYRVFVMERLLETNLKGGAVNTEDGNLKVLLEGKKKDIIAFVERLKREKPELAENPVLIGPDFDDSLEVPDEIRVSHALEMNQFGKAVVYLDGIDKKLDNLPDRISEKLGNKFDQLPDRINEKLGSKIDSLPDRISEKLGSKLDQLPDRISEKLGSKLDQLPDRISEKLGSKIDSLPKKIAAALKESR